MRRVWTVTLAVLLLSAFCIQRLGWLSSSAQQSVPRPSAQNPLENPIYQKYRFGPDDRIIDVGIQPLWLPPGIITEVMRRDRILERFLADRGMKMRLHAFLKGADVNAFMERGDLDAGIGGDMPALSSAARYGAIITSVMQRGFCSVVARKQMLITELRGRRIGIGFGSNAHYTLLAALDGAGMAERDIIPVFIDVTEMSAALDAHKIDAFSAWEPTPSNCMRTYPNDVVIQRGISSGFLYFAPDFYTRYPDSARAIVASQLRAVMWLGQTKNLRLAGKWAIDAGEMLSGESAILNVDDYVRLAREDILRPSGTCIISQADLSGNGRLAREFTFLHDRGIIALPVRWEDVKGRFDSSVVIDIMKQSTKYALNEFDYDTELYETE